MFKSSHKSIFIFFLGTAHVFALDESRLWLPTNYEPLYLDLKAAAEAAECLDRCERVVRGTVDLYESKKAGHPIFRIQCRQPNNRTYNEMVDGLTKKTLTTPVIEEKALTPEELEAKRLEEERARQKVITERKELFLSRCRQAFDEKTTLFIQKNIVDLAPKPKVFEMEKAVYHLDFDAEDINGVALAYRAICVVEMEKPLEMHIRKRRVLSH